MNSHLTKPSEELHFDDDTMDKVYDVMREEGGLTEKQTRGLIRLLRAKGFVFREKRTAPQPTTVYRGVQEEVVPVGKPSEELLLPTPVPNDQPNFPEGQPRGFANYLQGHR